MKSSESIVNNELQQFRKKYFLYLQCFFLVANGIKYAVRCAAPAVKKIFPQGQPETH